MTIAVRAAGMNPADAKHVARGDAADFPKAIGYEVAGVVSAVGSGSPVEAVGDEVLAFRISGGWATEVTVPPATSSPSRRRCPSAKPPTCSWPAAPRPRCCT